MLSLRALAGTSVFVYPRADERMRIGPRSGNRDRSGGSDLTLSLVRGYEKDGLRVKMEVPV